MVRYRKWILTLGIMAVTPGLVMGGPRFPFFKSKTARSAGENKPTKRVAGRRNQHIAEQAASALRSEKLSGYDIEVIFENGVAILEGNVIDINQKAKATSVVSKVPGVKRVDNRLIVLSEQKAAKTNAFAPPLAAKSPTLPTAVAGQTVSQFSSVRQIGSEAPALPFPPAPETEPKKIPTAAVVDNQHIAEQVAAALSAARLNGYDIEIRCQNGIALLSGNVKSRAQWEKATEAASGVPGVRNVENRLLVNGVSQQSSGRPAQQFVGPNPYAQAGGPIRNPYAGPQGQSWPVTPTTFQPIAGQPVSQGGAPGLGIGQPPAYGHPGSGATHTVYNMPHLPEYAWPSYASYPNYAQVAYPKQYSASAWPYIGPFYPYPQVPLGWRQVQLEWDDGAWSLNFRPRTDKWWWFMDPKNW